MTERIVVLDGYTTNPGDISWDPVAARGDLVLHDRTAVDDVIGRCEGAGLVLLNKTPFGKEIIDVLPDLRYVGVLATGYNVVDITQPKTGTLLLQIFQRTEPIPWLNMLPR